MWAKFNTVGDVDQPLVCKWEWGGSFSGWCLENDGATSGKYHFVTQDNRWDIYSDNVAVVGKWDHVAVTWGAGVKMYINGILQADTSASTASLETASSIPLQIGKRHTYGGGLVNGTLDEVKIYKRVLTPEEIRTHYLRGSGFGASGAITADKFRIVNTSGSVILATNDSKVGIGTTGPLWNLHVLGTTASLTSGMLTHNGLIIENINSPSLSLVDKMASGSNSGYVDFLTVNPSDTSQYDRWVVGRRGYTDNFRIGYVANNNNPHAAFTSPFVTIETGGNIGIGTTSPTETLEVVGNASVHNISIRNTAGQGALIFYNGSGICIGSC